MKQFKQTYLVLLIVIGLVSLALYSTYAMFEANINTNNIITINTSISLNTGINEYQIITLDSNSTKTININLLNTREESLYYGIWYKVISGKNYDVEVYKVNTSDYSAVDMIGIKEQRNIKIALINNSNKKVTLELGLASSNATELNLQEDSTLIVQEIDADNIKTKTIGEYIKTQYKENDKNLYIDGDNAIYYGDNPNNYIIFNNELWRILGVYNNNLKIIKDESIGTYTYDAKSNNWGESSINRILNELYFESTKGECYKNSEVSECDFINKGLTQESRDNVEKTKSTLDKISLETFTDIKEIKLETTEEVENNITLISLDDYIKSFNCNEDLCLNGSYLTSNNLLLTTTNEFNNTVYHIAVNEDETLNINKINIDEYEIKPVLTLKEENYIKKGIGTKDNPYVLK